MTKFHHFWHRKQGVFSLRWVASLWSVQFLRFPLLGSKPFKVPDEWVLQQGGPGLVQEQLVWVPRKRLEKLLYKSEGIETKLDVLLNLAAQASWKETVKICKVPLRKRYRWHHTGGQICVFVLHRDNPVIRCNWLVAGAQVQIWEIPQPEAIPAGNTVICSNVRH